MKFEQIESYAKHWGFDLKTGEKIDDLIIVGFNPKAIKSCVILGEEKTKNPVAKSDLINALVRAGKKVPRVVAYQYYSCPIEEIVNMLTPFYAKQGLKFELV